MDEERDVSTSTQPPAPLARGDETLIPLSELLARHEPGTFAVDMEESSSGCDQATCGW